MMDIYRNEITLNLSQLSDEAKLVFAVLTCEKLYPNYEYFSKVTHWGDPELLRNSIVLLHSYIRDQNNFEIEEFKNKIDEVDAITPNTEDFDGILTSFALDCCTAVNGSLQYIINKDINNIIDVAIYARDTVDMFIQEKLDLTSNDPGLEEKITQDSFMIKEKERQRQLIKELQYIEHSSLTEHISRLRNTDPIIDLTLVTK